MARSEVDSKSVINMLQLLLHWFRYTIRQWKPLELVLKLHLSTFDTICMVELRATAVVTLVRSLATQFN